MYTIARNAVIDYYRQKKESVDIEEADTYTLTENLQEKIDNQATLSEVKKFLEDTSPLEQEVVFLRVWDDLSYDEISHIVGKSVGNCKVVFSRAVAKIRNTIPYNTEP